MLFNNETEITRAHPGRRTPVFFQPVRHSQKPAQRQQVAYDCNHEGRQEQQPISIIELANQSIRKECTPRYEKGNVPDSSETPILLPQSDI